MRVTPEAYLLFDTGAPSVPELCDAFKYRFVPLFSAAAFGLTSSADIHTYKTRLPLEGVERLLMQVPEHLDMLLLGIALQEGCPYANLRGHQILIVPGRVQLPLPLPPTVQHQPILGRRMAHMVRTIPR